MNADPLKQYLREEGATLVGIGNVTEALSRDILHLNRGIAIAVNRNLNRETVEMLSRLQGLAEEWLRSKGYRSLTIPPDSDRQKDRLITKLYKLFCHKTAATCSGLGWVGKNGLVINREYGSKLSWATVLTNAPLDPDEPVRESECGDCDLCVTHCPSGAIRGDPLVYKRTPKEYRRIRKMLCAKAKEAEPGRQAKLRILRDCLSLLKKEWWAWGKKIVLTSDAR